MSLGPKFYNNQTIDPCLCCNVQLLLHSMKKIAFFILILFAVVQVLPTIQSVWGNDQAIVMDMNEEKKADKEDTKSNKEFLSFYNTTTDLSVKVNTLILLAENLLTSPCQEKLTPPPNFC